jgi:hypothetical protein
MKRISIRDKQFSEVSDADEALVRGLEYEAVVVNAAGISRAYYEGEYDPDKPVRPTCWSSNTQTPSADVPQEQRQAARCMDCRNNIRGSGYKSSRACRFSQRIAVVPHDKLSDVYQLHLPATSIFGEAKSGDMPMKAYARFLHDHDRPAVTVLTKMYFDPASSIPKLFFKPVRPLRDEEISVITPVINHPDTIRAITVEYTPFEGNLTSPFEVTDGFAINN